MAKALRERSGKSWGVSGGSRTAWGWFRIRASPARSEAYGYTSQADRAELGHLLGFGSTVQSQASASPRGTTTGRSTRTGASG